MSTAAKHITNGTVNEGPLALLIHINGGMVEKNSYMDAMLKNI